MKKENVIVLHPREWSYARYAEKARFNYVHVSIGGKVPRKRNGTPTYDGYADVPTVEGKEALEEAFKTLKPRAFLFWMHGNFPNSLLQTARRYNPKIKILHWYSNHRNQVASGVKKVLPYIDAHLMNTDEPDQFKMYKKAAADIGQDLKMYRFWDGFETETPEAVAAMNADVPQDWDVFFGGHSYAAKGKADGRFRFPFGDLRYRFIAEVGRRFKLRLHCAEAYKWPGLERFDEVFHPQYTVEMRRAKVNLDVNHFAFRHAYTRRKIRSIFSGRAHVSSYIPGMEDHFENGKHLLWFTEVDEGIEHIRRLLKDRPLRERMARECLKLAMDKFTFKHRLVEFEDILEDLGV